MNVSRVFKGSCICVILFFLFINMITTSADSTLALTDCLYDTDYTVTPTSTGTYISSQDKSLLIRTRDTLLEGCACGDKIMLLCKSESDAFGIRLLVYECDVSSGVYNSFELPIKLSVTSGHLTCDRFGRLYMTDYYDRYTVVSVQDGDIKASYQLDDYICQLMCLDGENILVFCEYSVYIITAAGTSRLRAPAVTMPVVYSGGGTITDHDGAVYLYRDKEITRINDSPSYTSSETAVTVSDEDRLNISTGVVLLEPHTTVSAVKGSVGADKSEVRIFKSNGNELTSGTVGTGMILYVNDIRYTLAVIGDLTGEGNINSRDLKLIMKHLTNEAPLDDLHKSAADLNFDGVINTKDLLLLSKMY